IVGRGSLLRRRGNIRLSASEPGGSGGLDPGPSRVGRAISAGRGFVGEAAGGAQRIDLSLRGRRIARVARPVVAKRVSEGRAVRARSGRRGNSRLLSPRGPGAGRIARRLSRARRLALL